MFENQCVQTASKAILCLALLSGASLWANHPVLVEGNCNNPPAGSPTVPGAGTCGDYDGDGKIGTDEDNDGDRVFGTIAAALGPGSAGTGANQNGAVTIVTSGTFAEVVSITCANGNVTLQAAPGVEADIDAVLQGDAGSTGRQNAPGIVVNCPATRYVVLRNLTSRNWTSGIRVLGNSRVAIENVRLENNINFGIEITDKAEVRIDESHVAATGFRVSSAGDFPAVLMPAPGRGISFQGNSFGAVFRTVVSGSFAAGVSDRSSGNVVLRDVFLSDNNPNREGVSLSQNIDGESDGN
jgi:hypothetical protein